MLTLFPKVPKTRPKALKIDVFDYPTVDASSPHKPYIARNYTHCTTSLPLIVRVYIASFKFSLWAPKTHVF